MKQICISRQENIATTMIGLEKVGHLISRGTIYELLYLHEQTDAAKLLAEALLGLYTSILRFLARTMHCLNGKTISEHGTTWCDSR